MSILRGLASRVIFTGTRSLMTLASHGGMMILGNGQFQARLKRSGERAENDTLA